MHDYNLEITVVYDLKNLKLLLSALCPVWLLYGLFGQRQLGKVATKSMGESY